MLVYSIGATVRASVGVTVFALALLDLNGGPPAGALEVGAYDHGYAARAAEVCADLQPVAPVAGPDASDPEFVKGARVVDENLAALGRKKTCRFAKRLYEGEGAKVAPLLKSP